MVRLASRDSGDYILRTATATEARRSDLTQNHLLKASTSTAASISSTRDSPPDTRLISLTVGLYWPEAFRRHASDVNEVKDHLV